MGYLYIAVAIIAMSYGQLIVKWQINLAGELPPEWSDKFFFLIKMFLNPWILTAVFATLVTTMAWMAAMTKFDLSYAYPFMSLNFVVVLLLSGWLLNEPLAFQKWLGVGLIVFGTVVVGRA